MRIPADGTRDPPPPPGPKNTRTFQSTATQACIDDSSLGLRGVPCNGTEYQKWKADDTKSGPQRLRNVATQRCLYDDG